MSESIGYDSLLEMYNSRSSNYNYDIEDMSSACSRNVAPNQMYLYGMPFNIPCNIMQTESMTSIVLYVMNKHPQTYYEFFEVAEIQPVAKEIAIPLGAISVIVLLMIIAFIFWYNKRILRRYYAIAFFLGAILLFGLKFFIKWLYASGGVSTIASDIMLGFGEIPSLIIFIYLAISLLLVFLPQIKMKKVLGRN